LSAVIVYYAQAGGTDCAIDSGVFADLATPYFTPFALRLIKLGDARLA
jgi:hypothetical protein